MKRAIIAFGLLTAAFAFAPTEAGAVVCAKGVVRAGCAGPNGAVVTRRPVAVVAPGAAVVVPRRVCHYVNGVRVCR